MNHIFSWWFLVPCKQKETNVSDNNEKLHQHQQWNMNGIKVQTIMWTHKNNRKARNQNIVEWKSME
jgi:hypothetical protein